MTDKNTQVTALQISLRNISSAVDTMNAKDIRSIGEEDFKHYFLPTFAGENPVEERREVLLNWVNVAGSMYEPVNVISSTGEIIAVVPPIQVTGEVLTSPNSEKPTNMSDIMQTSQLHANVTPAMGERVFREQTETIFRKLSKPEPSVQHTQQWEKLLNRFGKTLNKENSAKPDDSSNESGSFEY